MQVIAGKYSNRKLIAPESARPTLARVKTSLFSMINQYILDAKVLDLFAGSGAYGIECISRGCLHCTFVDKELKTKQVLLRNLHNIPQNLYEIITDDFSTVLKRFIGKKFNIIFLDPPYESEMLDISINMIERYELLEDGGIIVAETNSKKILQEQTNSCIMIKQKNYGTKKIAIYQKVK